MKSLWLSVHYYLLFIKFVPGRAAADGPNTPGVRKEKEDGEGKVAQGTGVSATGDGNITKGVCIIGSYKKRGKGMLGRVRGDEMGRV